MSLLTITIIGVLGAAALVITELSSTRGQLVLVTYGLTVIACGYLLRASRLARYQHRFWTAFVSLSSALLLADAYIVLVVKPGHLERSPSSYLWPVLFILGTSAIVGALLARVTPATTHAKS